MSPRWNSVKSLIKMLSCHLFQTTEKVTLDFVDLSIRPLPESSNRMDLRESELITTDPDTPPDREVEERVGPEDLEFESDVHTSGQSSLQDQELAERIGDDDLGSEFGPSTMLQGLEPPERTEESLGPEFDLLTMLQRPELPERMEESLEPVCDLLTMLQGLELPEGIGEDCGSEFDLLTMLQGLELPEGIGEDIGEDCESEFDLRAMLQGQEPPQRMGEDCESEFDLRAMLQGLEPPERMGEDCKSELNDTSPSTWSDTVEGLMTALREPHASPTQINALVDIAAVYEARFGWSSQMDDLDGAIAFYKLALDSIVASNPRRSNILYSLATALKLRFDRSVLRDDHVAKEYSHRLFNLVLPDGGVDPHGTSVRAILEEGQRGGVKDLNEAIRLYQEALELQPDPSLERSNSLHNLAATHKTRFQWDLRFKALAPKWDPDSFFPCTQSAQYGDLDRAAGLFRDALKLRVVPDYNRCTTLADLASVFLTDYSERGGLALLQEALALIREALTLKYAPHPDTLRCLSDAFYERYEEAPHLMDDVEMLIQNAITLNREALETVSKSHPHRSNALHDLARNLLLRPGVLKEASYYTEAILRSQEAVHALPKGHPTRYQYFMEMAQILQDVYRHTQQPSHLNDSMMAYREAAYFESASRVARLKAAIAWIDAFISSGNKHGSALDAFETLFSFRNCRYSNDVDPFSASVLSVRSDDMCALGIDYAIRLGRLDKAVEFIEHGRTTIWSALKRPSQPLRPAYFSYFNLVASSTPAPNLFTSASRILDNYYDTRHQTKHFTTPGILRWDGFREKLQSASARGPVVILVASDLGCCALAIMQSGGVKHIPLTLTRSHVDSLLDLVCGVTAENGGNMARMIDCLQELKECFPFLEDLILQTPTTNPGSSHHRDRGPRPAVIVADSEVVFRCVLGILWKEVVKPVIQSLALQRSELPPRLWWCPTGDFITLPIHAAGIYTAGGSEYLSNYVISSYIPSLNSLLMSPPPANHPLKVMVVIQPNSQAYSPLPGAWDELSQVERHVPHEYIVKFGIPDAPTSVKEVVSHLRDASIVHLACHGIQDDDINGNFFDIQGERLSVADLAKLSLPNAALAFLSACHTAKDNHGIGDEMMTLAMAMVHAGFRGVIATMWSVNDEDGPRLADAIYGHLFQHNSAPCPHPDITKAAQALHLAIIKLRDEGLGFKRWVPFIHVGL
ncbi:hypothetical protein PILCRDRAFT_9495 [Piloderma croceum F 1598]|uniref:CHAT domain-containing protein n=1 Tax=Piloderma croceum (strain F 1598) TaxID=765440 RepID=A0A0C3F7T0_PILCF|nr:hypothetical protein PILCRDRAFT_9495 [Piloderma croceum F 1598]